MKKRKGLRPLSQTGLPRVPANPKQRPFKEGGGKEPGQVLDAFNDAQETSYLHPTKGWRELSVRRSRVQMLTASIQNGATADLGRMREFLRHG